MQETIEIEEASESISVDIVSAHRTPEKLFDFSQNAHTRGISVVIAGAGGAALTRNGSLNVTTSSNRSSVNQTLSMAGTVFYQFFKCQGSSCSYCSLNGAKKRRTIGTQIIGSHDKKY
jgi:5-(carboxyamino)imidazole ribonucleotide mutase